MDPQALIKQVKAATLGDNYFFKAIKTIAHLCHAGSCTPRLCRVILSEQCQKVKCYHSYLLSF